MFRYSFSVKKKSFQDALCALDRMISDHGRRSLNNLELTSILLDRLNMKSALEKIRFVHVAGTKGKGTTSAYAAVLLQKYGYKVGLFTSPHLIDIRERTLVNNKMLSEELYSNYFFEVMEEYEKLMASESQMDRLLYSLTNFFRFLFILSLYIFQKESVDVAVIETGIGGRLDSTNVILPGVSIITSLGMDHMEILGDTVEKIAAEKAGIMKPGVICYADPQDAHPSTCKILEKHSREIGAPVVFVNEQTLPICNWPPLLLGGKHAIVNSKLGLLAARRIAGSSPIAPLSEVERDALQTMTLAGRSHIVSFGDGSRATFYLDGAHTPESLLAATTWFMEASSNTCGDVNPRRVLVFYSSRDPGLILKSFMPFVQNFSKVIIACVDTLPPLVKPVDSNDNSNKITNQARKTVLSISERWTILYQEVPCLPCVHYFRSLEEILELAVPALENTDEDASKPAQIFVTGSFYLVGHVISLINDYKSK